MNLSALKPPAGQKRAPKRIGRGMGSGRGKTATRGRKGQHAGTGFSQKRGFEGGQMPLARRIPKRGFTNIFREAYAVVNLDALSRIAKDEIGIEDLVASGLIKKDSDRVKVLGRGALSSPKTIHAHGFSESALKKIKAGGGKAVTIGKR